MLNLWRRHNPSKCQLKGRQERKCRCPIWISGVDNTGTHVKETTKLRDWTKAESLLRERDAGEPTNAERITIQAWRDACLADLDSRTGRNLKPVTADKYRVLFKQLDAFAADKGYRFVNQLDLVALSDFRQTWEDAFNPNYACARFTNFGHRAAHRG